MKVNKDGSPKKNPGWVQNQNIWDEIINGNTLSPNLCDRYVSIFNFEDANNYIYDREKGKPLSAYEFAKQIKQEDNPPIVQFVSQILGLETNNEKYTQYDLENKLVLEPYKE